MTEKRQVRLLVCPREDGGHDHAITIDEENISFQQDGDDYCIASKDWFDIQLQITRAIAFVRSGKMS